MEEILVDENVGTLAGIFYIESLAKEKAPDGHKKYYGRCLECGNVYCAKLYDFTRPKRCKHIGMNGGKIEKHYWTVKRLQTIFQGMKDRCMNNKDKDYRYYGAKGITICDEWLKNPLEFEKWALENGYQDNLTIDRKDSNQGYTPQNCQFISNEENSRKAGNVNWITINGMKKTGREWAQYIGRSINYVNKSIKSIGLEKTIEKIKEQMNEKPSKI